MKKELISEISRIHEIMGIEKPLLLESTCWFCKSIMDAIAELAELAKKGKISPAEYQIKINKLLNDVKNNTNLTLNQKYALNDVIKKFNELSSSADDLAKKTENARTAIYRSAEVLGDLPASTYAINWVNLYKSNEFIDDFFKFRTDVGNNISNVEKIFENSDEAGKRLSKYSSFDEYFDNALKPTFEKAYRDAGYDENMISSIVEKYRSKLKNNPKVGGKWNSPSPEVSPKIEPDVSKAETKDYDFLDDTEKSAIDNLLSKEVTTKNADEVRDELNNEIVKLKNTKDSDYPGDKSKIDELINKLRQKERVAIDLKMKESGGNYVTNPNGTSIKGSKTDGGVEENVELPDWMWNWWRGDDDDFFKGAKVNQELEDKVSKLEGYEFKPEEIEVTNKGVDTDGRDYLEIELPTGDKILLYRSSGTGNSALKGYGDWQVINGFGRHPEDPDWFWVVKSPNSTQYTKKPELSKYLTDMGNYLKNNIGTPSTLLGKQIKPLPISQFHIGGTSIDNVRSPGWRTISGSDPKIVIDNQSSFDPTASGAYQYYSFTIREVDENIIYSFNRKDIFDAAGRQGNCSVAVSYPKDSGVSLDNVKQILVDKSDEIHQQWLEAYNKKSGGVSIGGIKTPETAKSMGVNSKGLSVSEIPIIQR